MGGKLKDTAPRKSTTVGQASYVNEFEGSGTAQEFIFHGGVTVGRGIPIDFDHLEYVACTIQSSDNVFVVHQGSKADLYDQSMFDSGLSAGSGSPSIVVFTGKGKVSLTSTPGGRPFESSVLAPFANVETINLNSINGIIVANSFDGGDSALHGRAFMPFGTCSAERQWHSEGECKAWAEENTSSNCVDKWSNKKKQKKCQRYARKSKCFLDTNIGAVAREKCRKTCGVCT